MAVAPIYQSQQLFTLNKAVATDDPRGSLAKTVEEITALGGIGIAAHCDHSIDSEVQAAIRRIGEEQGRLDLLVNNVMPTPQPSDLPRGAQSFWDLHPFWRSGSSTPSGRCQ